MIQQKTVTVNGTEYMLTHMPATKGVKALKMIVKLVGPAFASMQKGGIPAAIEALFDNIDAVDVEELLKGLVSTASKGNMAINYDSEFAGEYDKLFLLVQEVVEFNFGSVFTLFGSDDQ
ncbi:MAG: hypothetical protein CL573_00650 [Alphaproteobacteria bacterium]|nr:hypothetical protein [Alphaproteobacteria bacterium]|tara:strand:- start:295 stop:651 length:357 start_codon:yes stop_codon:yes gene_type:complete